nr:LysR family transcriptional regulator [uncultured Blautia sp.]
MDINLELYKVFYYVATTLSFSEASRQLYISQSAVSQAVKNLEKKLGHTLFIRSTKRVVLTPEGELLLQHVKPAISMLNEGELILSGEGNLTGQLRIAASDTLCRYFLIQYLRKFHKDYPDVRIKVINSTSTGCAELLENGQAELIISNYPNSRLNSHARLQTVLEFRDIFVANPDFFPMEAHRFLSLEELLDYPILMLSPKSTTSEYLHQVFAAQGLKLLPEVELNSNELLMDLAKIGLGVACVPDYMLTDRPRLVPVPLKTPLPGRKAVIAHHDSLPLSQAAERFLQYFNRIR